MRESGKSLKIFTFKTFILSLLFLLAIGLFTGCSPSSKEKGIPNPSVAEIGEAIEKSVDLSDMKQLDDTRIQRFYDIAPDEVDEFWGLISASNIKAQEVLVIKAKEPTDIDEIKEKVLNRVSEQAESFKDYLPEEYFLIENHVLKVKDNYIFLVISKDADNIEDIFDSFF